MVLFYILNISVRDMHTIQLFIGIMFEPVLSRIIDNEPSHCCNPQLSGRAFENSRYIVVRETRSIV